jgi:epoxide hydrolase
MERFQVGIADDDVADLRRRLAATRWPDPAPAEDWEQGTDLAYLRELVDYWRADFDWRVQERRLNDLDHFVTEIDGQRVHFVHARSRHPGALPLVLSHGWPGSIIEFLDVFGPLTDPPDPADAFHVVAPSLPGYGFSGPVSEPGWHPRRIADAFTALMARLGYARYGVQGGDWGSIVSQNMADLAPDRVAGLHVNFVSVPRPRRDRDRELDPEERASMDRLAAFQATGAGYSAIQSTKPQTLGYALDDSPTGVAAWIVEKFRAWSDCGGDVERSFTKDQLLTNVALYWFTRTATSSARLYYEMRRAGRAALPQAQVDVPTAVANYPGEIGRVPRRWVEHRFRVTHWVDQPRGGHFAAMEVPDLFVDDLRSFFRTVR